MDSIYIFIKKSEITTAMINRSTSKNIGDLPFYTVANPWYYFGITDEFAVLEIETKELSITNVYDNYKWYSHEEAIEKIKEFEQSQL